MYPYFWAQFSKPPYFLPQKNYINITYYINRGPWELRYPPLTLQLPELKGLNIRKMFTLSKRAPPPPKKKLINILRNVCNFCTYKPTISFVFNCYVVVYSYSFCVCSTHKFNLLSSWRLACSTSKKK